MFLLRSGALAAGIATACGLPGRRRPLWEGSLDRNLSFDADESAPHFDPGDWSSVRSQFAIADRPIDLSALYISSHPAAVRQAIARYRTGLDRDPTLYLIRNNRRLTAASIEAAARYMRVDSSDIALTDSTTMGLGLLYNGLWLSPGQEIVTTEHDYYATHESLRQASKRSGAAVRRIALYDRIEDVSEQEIVGRIVASVSPRTRVLALTWVHSGTGLKLPLASIAEAVREINEERDEVDRVLLCVDGVHGLGVEDATMDDLGFDFFVAGTHKWVFGPRGTGILWGRGGAWQNVRPSIPSFLDDASWAAWGDEGGPSGRTTGARMTPGGFKPFEHRWALAEAFGFHERIGKSRVEERTHAMARRLKEGLAETRNVRLITPLDERLSSGIVCFSIRGWSPEWAVSSLRERGIVATVTPYAVKYVRFAPSIRNTADEVEAALAAVRELV